MDRRPSDANIGQNGLGDVRTRHPDIGAASDALGEAVPLGMAGLTRVEDVLARCK